MKTNINEWKCLSCGSKGSFSQFSPQGWCSNCNSKNLEVYIHYTCLECPNCHKVKDVIYHGISLTENEVRKNQAKENWLKTNEWCLCSIK